MEIAKVHGVEGSRVVVDGSVAEIIEHLPVGERESCAGEVELCDEVLGGQVSGFGGVEKPFEIIGLVATGFGKIGEGEGGWNVTQARSLE